MFFEVRVLVVGRNVRWTSVIVVAMPKVSVGSEFDLFVFGFVGNIPLTISCIVV